MAKISRVGTMQEVISLLIGKTMKRKNDKSEKRMVLSETSKSIFKKSK
jgi:hypothetical protein